MQRNYGYRRTETGGKNFTPDFVPELTPGRCSPQAFLEEKYLSDGRGEIPANQFARAKLSPQGKTPQLNYFGVAARRLHLAASPAPGAAVLADSRKI